MDDQGTGTRQLVIKPPPKLIQVFQEAFQTEPDFVVRAPGRVDLIGAHVDYNEGLVLPVAIDRYVWLAVKEWVSTMVALHAIDMDGEEVAFRLTEIDEKQTISGRPLPGWARYAAGVVWSLQETGLATPGSRLAVMGEIPIGAGLSSSAAVEVAYASAWAHITGWEVEKMELAQLCRRAENEYVGVECGLMDQFASLFGRKDHALLFDTRTHRWEIIPMPEGIALVVADTGTRRILADSAFNTRQQECEQAVSALQKYLPHITALRDVTPEAFEKYAEVIPEPARQRAQHVVEEIVRVQATADALKKGDVEEVGRLMDRSHVSARDLYETGAPALDAMWEASHGHPARLGGRVIGAGWAGCLLFLVKEEGAEDFITHTGRRYAEAMGQEGAFEVMQAADGAKIMPLRGM